MGPFPTPLSPPDSDGLAFAGRSMPTPANPPQATDEQVRFLLERYKCSVPFHKIAEGANALQ